MVDLSIIIVNWNVKDILKDCLESIRKNVSGIAYEVVIVDNNSADGSIEMIEKEYPEVLLIRNRQNLGYARANNQGIMKAKGKYVLILNPDTIVLPETVEKMYRFLEENPGVGACGPSILDTNHRPFSPMIYDPTLWELFGKDSFLRKFFPKLSSPRYPQPKKRKDVERLSGCCFLSSREALKTVGLFDERIFLFYEEADLFFRLRRMGWAVYYLPELSIVHLHGKSVSLFSRFQEELFVRKSSLIYFRNRYGLIPSIFLRIFLILSYLLYAIILEAFHFLCRQEIYQEKKIFYNNLLKVTVRSLFGLN
jgi:GT2 family glycosyltransferase